MTTNRQVNYIRDTKILLSCSCICIICLLTFLFFSPLSSQFAVEDVGRGDDGEDRVMEEIVVMDYEEALNAVDNLIVDKQEGLPRVVYFDRFLAEDERIEAANARADIYDLQWNRIMILKELGNEALLIEALEDYSTIIGYNQDKAKALLHSLKSE